MESQTEASFKKRNNKPKTITNREYGELVTWSLLSWKAQLEFNDIAEDEGGQM